MVSVLKTSVLKAFCLSLLISNVSAAAPGELPHVRASLIADVSSIGPGDSFNVLLQQSIDPGWHTYWRNPGDSGAEPTIRWDAPEGVTVGAFEWPYPERIPYGPLMNFGYHDQVSLPFTVSVATDYKGGEVQIRGTGRILVCEEICIPEKVELFLHVPFGTTASEESNAALFASVRARIPTPISVGSQFVVDGDGIELTIGLPGIASNRVTSVEYFPYAPEVIDNPAAQRYRFDGSGLTLNLKQGYGFDESTADFSGVLVITEESGGEEVVSSYAFGADAAGASLAESGADQVEMGLMLAALFAFAGGVILNLMPCVFPILSIKILSLIEASRSAGSSIRLHGWSYAIGVILSFVLIAAILIALRLGGEAIGWGFQLQSPVVVGLLAYLFVLIALNLLGVFEFGTSIMTLAGAGGGDGYGGSFATGVLATLVAAPCTAPFMGAAVGYALTQSPFVAVLIFGALGAGMAAPYLLLCYMPSLLSRLPGPGQWMVTMKQVMAFPMFASAIWLIWVLGIQTGVTGMMQIMGGALLLAFAVWLNSLYAKGDRGVTLVRLFSVGLVAGAVYIVTIQETVAVEAVKDDAQVGGASGVYSAEALASALEQGPVFVNFTAAWCITCKVNEINALDKTAVKQVFLEKGVTYLKADWTSEDPKITAALAAYGRSGVPLYLLYEKQGVKARVLPQILTEGIVLDAVAGLVIADD